MKKIFFFILSHTLHASLLFAQQSKIDSLENILQSSPKDTFKVNLLNELCRSYLNINPQKSLEYGFAAINLSDELNFFTGKANTFNSIGVVYMQQSDFSTALAYYDSSLKIFERINDKSGEAKCLGNIGIVCRIKGDFSKALNFQLKSLKIREELSDKPGMAKNYTAIGNLYHDIKNIETALEYHRKALLIQKELNNKTGIAACYTNIGNIYWQQGKDSAALSSYNEGMKIHEEINDKTGVAHSLNNIALIYDKKNDPSALDYYLSALKIRIELGDKSGISSSYLNIGEYYGKKGNHPESIKYLLYALSISKEIGRKEGIRLSSNGLSIAFEKSRDYKNAYEYHKLYSEIKDSIFNEESSKQIAEMQTKYETEKKELQIENLNKDNDIKETEIKKQNIQKIAFASGFGLMLILAFVIFRGYNQKKKANEIITAQKVEVEKQKEMVDEKNKSLEVAYKHIEEKNTEILDSIRYAKRIQEAILPPQKLVKQHLEQSFILYKPKDIVAGDFYWMHSSQESGVRSLETGHPASGGMSQPSRQPTPHSELVSELPTPNSQLILFAVVDCTGHGVPGAFMSILGFNGLNRCVKEFGLTQPSKILDKLCELVDEAFSKSESDIKDGMDIALCALELPSPNGEGLGVRVQYAGAGNSLYLIRKTPLPNGEGRGVGLTEYKADKQPIGKFSNRKPFTNHEIQLQKGDSIYIFTDGYADQFGGPKGKKFKYSQFEKLLISIQEKSMTEQREILNNAIDEWKGDLDQIDDICIIGVGV